MNDDCGEITRQRKYSMKRKKVYGIPLKGEGDKTNPISPPFPNSTKSEKYQRK